MASDPVVLRVHPGTHLAVSLYLRAPERARDPAHPGAAGQLGGRRPRTLDSRPAPSSPRPSPGTCSAASTCCAPRRDRGAVVALGDSITDGVGSPLDANARYPNDLARRFAARAGATLSVVDEGIGGNRVLDQTPCCGVGRRRPLPPRRAGPARRARRHPAGGDQRHRPEPEPRTADRAPHLRVSALQIVEGYERIIAMAHAAGLRVFGATLTPFHGARYWTPAGEAKREAVNALDPHQRGL